MGRYVAGEAPAMDQLVEASIKSIGAEIDALGVPKLQGVVLGGGYGRGEGGVKSLELGVKSSELRVSSSGLGGESGEALSNDLDFFAVTEEGASHAEIAAIGTALAPVARRWTERLGVDVDFTVRTPWRLRHDQTRVMIQELIHGYFDVTGKKGTEMFRGIEIRPPSVFPWSEAVRLLVNRGVGLLLAYERMQSSIRLRQGYGGQALNSQSAFAKASTFAEATADKSADKPSTLNPQPSTLNPFILRNINKCVLGAGDARLIARGDYRWRAEDRAAALDDRLYAAAVSWKFRPREEGVCSWDDAQAEWLKAVDEVMAAGRRGGEMRRTLYQAVRWLVRRRTVGDWRTLGYGAVVRILLKLSPVVSARAPLPPSLRRDWEVFN